MRVKLDTIGVLLAVALAASPTLAGTVVAGPLATGSSTRSARCVVLNTGDTADTVTAQITRRSGVLLASLPPTALAPGASAEVAVNFPPTGERLTCSVTGDQARNVTFHSIGLDQGSAESVAASGS